MNFDSMELSSAVRAKARTFDGVCKDGFNRAIFVHVFGEEKLEEWQAGQWKGPGSLGDFKLVMKRIHAKLKGMHGKEFSAALEKELCAEYPRMPRPVYHTVAEYSRIVCSTPLIALALAFEWAMEIEVAKELNKRPRVM